MDEDFLDTLRQCLTGEWGMLVKSVSFCFVFFSLMATLRSLLFCFTEFHFDLWPLYQTFCLIH